MAARDKVICRFPNDDVLDRLSCADTRSDDENFELLFPEFLTEGKVLIEGVLEKRGRWNSAWKPRYFVLEDSGRLSYFNSEEDKCWRKRALGIIPIDTRSTVTNDRTSDKRRSILKIHVPGKGMSSGRTFDLSSLSKEVSDQWFTKLSSMQDSVIYTSLPGNIRHW